MGTKKNTYPSYEKAKLIVQENELKNIDEYRASYKELELPAAPDRYYKEKGWISWPDFFGRKKVSYPTYEKAKRIVQESGIKGKDDYKSSSKVLGLPSNPNIYYEKKGWTNWYDFLGKKESSYPTYEEAKRIVQENGIKSIKQYNSSYKELELPSVPGVYYKENGWTNWYDFLGKIEDPYPTYEEAKRIVQTRGIKNKRQYISSNKELGLPAAPEAYYEKKGWNNWYDFLGKTENISPKEREINILSKLSICPTLLEDDAPPKIIYMLASEVDKNLAIKMEELLSTTSYEDRLNWVKNQLKNLKVDISHMSPTSTDRLSALKSIVKVYEDVIDTLPEETVERINTILENYAHSLINRELIKENDG